MLLPRRGRLDTLDCTMVTEDSWVCLEMGDNPKSPVHGENPARPLETGVFSDKSIFVCLIVPQPGEARHVSS